MTVVREFRGHEVRGAKVAEKGGGWCVAARRPPRDVAAAHASVGGWQVDVETVQNPAQRLVELLDDEER